MTAQGYIVGLTSGGYEEVNGAEMCIFGLSSLEFYFPDGRLIVAYAAGQWKTVVTSD